MPSIKHKIFTVFLLIFSIKGYSGTIKGNISDKSNGEPLAGAIVMLHGTKYGTSTGLDGSYIIHGVPAGQYDLEIMYTSYETCKEHIKVLDDQTVTINKSMASSFSVLSEVEIKSTLKNGSDEQARNIEKNSDVALSIISAKSIELLPDITVANVLMRVSGVQLNLDANGEPRYAIIRGMPPRYNYTTVDGVKVASPDDKARFVPLDIFPAEILDRIEVIKTLIPSMEADATGGVTNLVMKNAPDHLVVYATAATGYNENSLDEHYNSFDKGAIAPNDPESLYGPNYTARISDFPLTTSIIKPIQAPVNGLYSLSLGDRFLKHKLGVMFTGSYQNTYKETNDIFFKPAAQPEPGNIPEFDDLDIRKYSTQETRIGMHLNMDYKINDKNTLTLGALFVNLNQLEERNIVDTDITGVNRTGPGFGEVDYKDRTAQRIDNIENISLKGTHLITDRLKVDWIGSASKATRDVPDMTEFETENNFQPDPTGGVTQTGQFLKSVTKSWEKTSDQDIQGFLNITYTPSIFGKDFEFKAGAMDRNKDRVNYYNEYDLGASGQIGGVPYTNVQSINPSTLIFTQSPLGIGDDNGLSYHVHENIYAYYAQVKFHLLDEKLEILGGIRAEHTFETDSANLSPFLVSGVSGTYQYLDVLPSGYLKYKLNAKTNLRLAYYESISRPNFFELVNYSFTGEDFTEIGNPYLLHSVAQNFDARYEWFIKGLDQVVAGLFYKNITNPIEYGFTRFGGPSAQQIQPQNDSANAINYGAEILITKFFHYFGISANYTYTHSSITSPEIFLTQTPTGEVNTMVSETRPLQGQAANIANLSFIYRNPELGLDIQLAEQYTGRHIFLTSQYEGLDYWQKGIILSSFSIEKRIIKHLSVYAKVNNLFNSPAIVEMDYSNKQFTNPALPAFYLPDQNLKDGRTLVESTYYGRNYLIGIRYKLD